ncbi:succinyl-diaminopimelate desuccinylase [Micrococcales bacterium 31B]|nr:succinyl-diaminopimelate desuccinylase [Micrococcales bacterium 31B]
MTSIPTLDLTGDLLKLTRDVCDIESVSGNEKNLADAIEAALAPLAHLEMVRDGDAIVARTHLGRPERVVIAGHIDTVPLAGNLPTWVEGEGADAVLFGRGTCDMKGGVAMQLHCAAAVTAPSRDVTWVFYDLEEVESAKNGLGRLMRTHPDLLAGDFAILGEPTAGALEGGCKGTLRAELTLTGTAAHSGRAWIGDNAIHRAAPLLQRLAEYGSPVVEVDGLDYRECLSAVKIEGGIAGNVVPDRCVVTVNFRFAPNRTAAQAEADLRDYVGTLASEFVLTDAADGARPGLQAGAAKSFKEALGADVPVRAKQGWTDVARFSALGIPAVNFGPADPLKAHADDEHCPVPQLYQCAEILRRWLES